MTPKEFRLDSILERVSLEDDGFNCLPEGAGYRLQLWGRLPSNWAGNLTLHAFAAGLQIVTGDALRTHRGIWASSFLLRPANLRNPTHYDFLNMARHGPRMVPELPEPEVKIVLRPSNESSGDVFARVAGQDSVGLIAHLLRRFSHDGLHPRRFMLRTDGHQIRDWFWLEPAPSLATDLPQRTAASARLA